MDDEPTPDYPHHDAGGDQKNAELPQNIVINMPQPPKRSIARKILGGLAYMALVVFVFSTMLQLLTGMLAGSGPGGQPFVVTEVESGDSLATIAIVSLMGEIDGAGSYIDGTGMVYQLSTQFEHIAHSPDIRAVILQVQSPGGGLTASDLLYNKIKDLQKAGKIVVVMVGDHAASGGYYISAPADYIVCPPTGQVGSIGVIMQRFQIDQLLEKVGVKVEPITSTGMKDIGSPFRDMTPEEKNLFQKTLQKAHERFIHIIAEGRNISDTEVAKLANGTMYTAARALELNLIDEIGYFDTALAKAKELAKITGRPRIVRYNESHALFSGMMGAEATETNQAHILRALISRLQNSARPMLLAEWAGWPGK